MFGSLLKTLFGTSSERDVKRLMPILEQIRAKEADYARMTNDELRAQTAVFKARLAQACEEYHTAHAADAAATADADADAGANAGSAEDREEREKAYAKGLRDRLAVELDALLPDAFSAVREASKRVVGMRPFDVQMIGGIVLHRAGISEMVTGEGKTLVATMPVYLNALTGDGVHIVTVNDYLARRDSEWMGPIYKFMGLTVGLVQHDMSTAERQVGYRADITYGTNNEFGFDYLRDNMAVRPEMRVQRTLNYAIIDEVDSILIDEARTPLIIAGYRERDVDEYKHYDDAVRQLKGKEQFEHEKTTDSGFEESDEALEMSRQSLRACCLFKWADDVVRNMKKGKHFRIDEEHQDVMLLDAGRAEVQRLLDLQDLCVDDAFLMFQQSLRAHHFFKSVDNAVRQLKAGKHFQLEEDRHEIILTERGIAAVRRLLRKDELEMFEQSLRARHFFKLVDDAVRRLEKGKYFRLDEDRYDVILTDEGIGEVERLLDAESLSADDSIRMFQESLRAKYFFELVDDAVRKFKEGKQFKLYGDSHDVTLTAVGRETVKRLLQEHEFDKWDFVLEEKGQHVMLTKRGRNKVARRLGRREAADFPDMFQQSLRAYHFFKAVDDAVRQFEKGTHFELDKDLREVRLKEEGRAEVERLLELEDSWVEDYVYMFQQSLRAHHFFKPVDNAVRQFEKGKHFTLSEARRNVELREDSKEEIERLLKESQLQGVGEVNWHMIEQALRAHYFYKRDDEYMVVKHMMPNGKVRETVLIVDEFTGRAMEGRRWSDGLHEAIEAKEGVEVQSESQTVATITYQKLFKLYHKISGMTGTAATEAIEFNQIYGLDVVQIPTNLPLIREDRTDLVFASEMGKFRHVVDEILSLHDSGRPVLVGTVSIEKSELVAKLLEEHGAADFQVLNAKHHEREASIVANAGKRGSITIATNMAGRGTDIKLGEGVRELGGLAIVGTERHESRRIDNQLRGRCGRQGDPGTTRFYVSLEDEVARLFGGDRVKRLLDMFGSNDMDEEPLSQKMVTKTIERAQRQVEEYNFEIRKHLLEYDDVMDKQRQIIYRMRRDVLEDRDVTERIRSMFENITTDLLGQYAPEDVQADEWDLDGLRLRFRGLFGFDADLDGEGKAPLPMEAQLLEQVLAEYARREELIGEKFRGAFREQIGGDESRVDFARFARKRVHDFEMMALLRAVDDKWIEHLYSMDYLKESVRLRAYGQKEPLLEYKMEGFEYFQAMMKLIEEDVAQTLFHLTDPEVGHMRQIQGHRGTLARYNYVAANKEQDRSFASYDTSRFALAGQSSAAQEVAGAARNDGGAPAPKVKPKPIRTGPKTKPNDPCPCGSGKKFKKCCGAQR